MMVFGVIVMWAMLSALVLCAVLWPLARRADRRGALGLLHTAALRLRQLTLSALLALSAVFIGSVAHSGKNTNNVQNVGGMYLMQFNPPSVQTVAPQDFSNGWRVVEETTGELFVQPPANAVTNERWRLRGAHDDAFRISADGWSYPYATGITVLSRGELRSNIHAHDFPRAFEQDLSLLPLVNWPILPEGRRESFFWYAATPSNTLLATWCNAALGRDATNPVNFQAELFTDGGFDYRYEDRAVRHVRVWPFDWDNDGLENSVDPDPLTPGTDAHGTNAEWYNTVCSNVFSSVEGGGTGTTGILPVEDASILPWRDGVNSNAYYFVDVVAAQGPAPIYFTGDRESRLGNPVVVALADETNRVPLLIGIDYAITSSVPFAVSFPNDGLATVTTNGLSNYELRWPLEFVFTENLNGSDRVYSVTVEPYDPGGELTWNGVGAGMRSGVSAGCGCGCLHCGDNSVWFSCSAVCACDGGCQAVGGYTVENALFAVTGGVCRCGFDDPVEIEVSNSVPFSVSFSSDAVIFEDAYEDSPGVTKPKRSTRVRITVDAYGGEHGGVLSLSSANLGKLEPVGSGVVLPPSLVLAAEESFHSTGVYEGAVESGAADDVTVSGTFTEYVTAQQHQSSNTLTVVKVRFSPHVTAPENYASGRHEYGVCELVRCYQNPSAPPVTWNPIGGGYNTVDSFGHLCYKFPLSACENPLRVELGDVIYVPRLSCIEPSGIEVREVDLCTYGLPAGKAGGIGLLQAFYVKPFTVSFSEIAVEEVPCTNGTANGYFRYAFTSNFWSHTVDAGAGKWFDVSVHNRMGALNYRDEAALAVEMLPITPDGTLTNDYSFGWMEGSMTWEVPFGWNVKGTTNGTQPSGTFEGTTQEFCIEPSGFTGVRKFHNQATRYVNDARYLNWRRIYNNEVRNP